MTMNSAEILNTLIENGILVSPELFEAEIDEKIIKKIIREKGSRLDYLDMEIIAKEKDEIENEQKKIKGNSKVNITRSYNKTPKKRTFQDFVSLFNIRFNSISQMLKNRQELQGVTSISRILQRKQNEKISVIGMIKEKSTTKNNNTVLTLEDVTGTVNLIITNNDKNAQTHQQSKDLVLDEIIGVVGTWSGSVIFPDKIILPEIPLSKELKKQKEEEYLVLMGDTHFGSKVFMKEEFEKFIHWIQGNSGNEEQRRMAALTKYVILTGDIVEGVGIYPSQESDLEILDIKEQYDEAAKWLKKIPERINIIVMSGNHDAGRLSEPQETPFKDMAKAIWDLPNITMVSNPAYVNIGMTKDFPGFDILLYHGGSLIYYSDNVPSIRAAGGQKRSDLIMKFLLQRRHLAPTHGSTLYLPDSDQDHLLIDIVPDFFITGHIHRSSVANYRNITMINSSCWTETTEDNIKRGLEPLPARVSTINLKTREVKILNFLSKENKEKEQEYAKEIQKLKGEEKKQEI